MHNNQASRNRRLSRTAALFWSHEAVALGQTERQDTFASGLNPYSVHGMTEVENGRIKYRTGPFGAMRWLVGL